MIEEKAAESKRQRKRAECEAARPSCCPECGAPSRPVGRPLQMHGHGERERTQRGPEAVGQPPAERKVGVRRYKCKKCGATVTVAPRGVLRRRLYGACGIGLALSLFGIQQESADAVRKAVAPTASARDPAEGATWSTLRRWAHEAKAGTLFVEARACPETFTLRQAAARAATTLSALGPRGPEALGRVWQGALSAHWGRDIERGAKGVAAPTHPGGCRGNEPSARLSRAPPGCRDSAERPRSWNPSLRKITPSAWRSSATL
jgi:hypothetical protein